MSFHLLLGKLRAARIGDSVYSWFADYLSNRTQETKLGGLTSNKRVMKISVLQGSVLGPILFLIFINDLGDLKIMGEIISLC